ncbi:MAG: protein kinase [Polyangiaceae bacterium]
MRPQVGQVIHNKYRLIRLIGDGGMGSVFEARHEVLGTTVALKFLHPELSRRSGLVQRFLQEARVSAQIQSPHVVRVTDVDQNETGQAFIVMEYLEGKTLQTLYEELYHARQRLSYGDALEYAMQMLEGVEAAHNAGVVHRDLKPDNVIITRGKKNEPLLKLLDFGIAKLKVTGQLDRGLTRPGIIMGTPEYMAPEQAYSADAVDARADIFSLGVMTFEMLAGRRPVGGDEPHQIATAYLTRNIAKLLDLAPHVPAELAAAIHRAMGPKPEDRWSSVAELRTAIEPFWMATRPSATPVPPGLSVVTPAPAQASPAVAASPVEGVRRVPKTLPPEDEAPAPVVSPAPSDGSSGQSIEVVFSDRSASLAPGSAQVSSAPATTPVSRMPELDQSGPTPQPAEAPAGAHNPSAPPANAGPAAFAATDATVEAQPIQGRAGSGTAAMPMVVSSDQPSTVEAQPLAMGGMNGASTAHMAPPERAGGTAIGGSPMFAASPATEAAPGYAPVPAGLPATASMDPVPFAGPPPARPARRASRSTGASFFLILLAAAAVAGAVVGGVYLAQQRAREQDHTDDPPVAVEPPPATVSGEQPAPTVAIPTTPSTTTVANPRPLPKPTVTATSTSTSPTATTQPTTAPSSFPTSLPTTLPTIPTSLLPIPLPTVLPFPFPGQQQPGRPNGGDPSPVPTLTSPQPQPTSTGTTTTKKPQIIIKFPKKD